jgi:hypothetical protein
LELRSAGIARNLIDSYYLAFFLTVRVLIKIALDLRLGVLTLRVANLDVGLVISGSSDGRCSTLISLRNRFSRFHLGINQLLV